MTPDSGWNDVCWSPALGLFCAVGERVGAGAAIVMTSPDGVSWTGQPGLASTELTAVCWSPTLNLFLAVGINLAGTDSAWTSPDGVTWTPRGLPIAGMIGASCIWVEELGLFVFGGSGGGTECIATSPDGIAWTSRSTPWDDDPSLCNFPLSTRAVHFTSTGFVADLAWSPTLGLIVAVGANPSECCGDEPIYCYPTTSTIMTSPDGVNWTQQADAFDGSIYDQRASEQVVWFAAAGIFAAGIFATSSTTLSAPESIQTSPDGVTWTAVLDAAGANADEGRRGDDAVSIVLMGGGVSAISVSADGAAWTASALPPSPFLPGSDAVAYSPDLDVVVVVGRSGSSLLRAAILIPVPTTGDAVAGVCTADATLNGDVVPNTPGGSDVTWLFEYGPTAGYGSSTPGGSASGLGDAAVTDLITPGPAPGTVHYRLVAIHDAVTEYGDDEVFTQAACPSAGPVLEAILDLSAG